VFGHRILITGSGTIFNTANNVKKELNHLTLKYKDLHIYIKTKATCKKFTLALFILFWNGIKTFNQIHQKYCFEARNTNV